MDQHLLLQIAQIGGALLLLSAFVLSQGGRLDQSSRLYFVLNFAGSAILAGLAALDRQWGFLLLEGTWALVSLWSLFRLTRGEKTGAGQ